MSVDPTLQEVGARAESPTFGFLRAELAEGPPREGRRPGLRPVMLHRPRSTGRVPRPPPGTGRPEGAADAAGAQDTVSVQKRRWSGMNLRITSSWREQMEGEERSVEDLASDLGQEG